MAKEGDTLTLEKDKIYIILGEEADNTVFEVHSTIDEASENGVFLSAIARGLIETAMADPDAIVKKGIEAFFDDGLLEQMEVNKGTLH